jgi:tetratricopeptide (TPR) repeat protein
MQKKHLITGALILALFAAITLLKPNSDQNSSLVQNSEKTAAEKEKIRRFWKIYRQATSHRLAGEIEQAASAYEKAIALNENHEDALYYFGNVSLELGQYEKAEQAWQRLVEINPQSARAYQQLGNLYLNPDNASLFDIKKAEEAFQQAHRINREETGPVLRLGEVALIKHDFEQADEYFDAVLGANSKSVEANFLKGYIAWKRENTSRARFLYQRAITSARPENPVKGILGEGDTKPGESKTVSKRFDIFQAVFEEIKAFHLYASNEMASHYQKLDKKIDQLKKLPE